MDLLNTYKIILGSKSPRRSELLNKADIPFENRLMEVEEIYPEALPASEVPEFLAKLKASAFEGKLAPNELLICADTIVIQNAKVIGKPKNREDAKITLASLSNKWHTVVSGVCLKTNDRLVSFSCTSQVKFYELTDLEIDYYIETYQPYDKAGSYGIQDWIGIAKIEKIDGSYTNIMGLPMGKLYQVLKDF